MMTLKSFIVLCILFDISISSAIDYEHCEHTIMIPSLANGTESCGEHCRVQCANVKEHVMSNCLEVVVDSYVYDECCCNPDTRSFWTKLWH
ncbi:hypothetical protein AAVH_24537 [Aphelenchoides avenae]|nr:hypothetical protein AAVH_24537 [Aphelenchus avenae]